MPLEITEDRVERNVVKQYKSLKGIAYKFVSPGRDGVPDRLCLRPVPTEPLRKVVGRYVRFIETKAPGEDLRPDQRNEKEFLESLGFTVEVVDDPKWKIIK